MKSLIEALCEVEILSESKGGPLGGHFGGKKNIETFLSIWDSPALSRAVKKAVGSKNARWTLDDRKPVDIINGLLPKAKKIDSTDDYDLYSHDGMIFMVSRDGSDRFALKSA